MASSIQARTGGRRRRRGAAPARREGPAGRIASGGDALVATLLDHGVDVAFGVPGESYLAVLEALREAQDRLRFVVTRHESGATFAACAYGRLARKPGVAFVTRGPGATNAAIGLHTARQDSVPLLLFIGQVPSDQRGREAFQEIDYHQMLAPLTKAVFEPHDAGRGGRRGGRGPCRRHGQPARAGRSRAARGRDRGCRRQRAGPCTAVTPGAAAFARSDRGNRPASRCCRAARRDRGRDGGLRGRQRGARRLRRGPRLRRAQLLPPAGGGAVRAPRLSGHPRPCAAALSGGRCWRRRTWCWRWAPGSTSPPPSTTR